MSPTFVSDGDYSQALQDGHWRYERPFTQGGDFDTYIATRTMKVDRGSFVVPIPMTQIQFERERNSTAYLVDFKGPTDGANNIYFYEEIYAPLPKTRTEYRPVVFTQPYVLGANLIQSTDEVQGEYVYEYSKGEPLPPLLHTIFQSTPSGIIVIPSGKPLDPNVSIRILTKDAIASTWMGGKLFERVSIFTRTKTNQPYP